MGALKYGTRNKPIKSPIFETKVHRCSISFEKSLRLLLHRANFDTSARFQTNQARSRLHLSQ
jgi:hypothetical protein